MRRLVAVVMVSANAMIARRVTFLSSLAVVVFGCGSSSTAPATPDDSGVPLDGATDVVADAGDGGDDASLDDPPIDPKYQAFADAVDAERKKMGASGAAVALLEHGEVTFFHGFGTKGPNSTDPVRARTLFRIGSMTKALTAATVLSLVDQGKIDLAQPVTTYAPKVSLTDTALASLTVREILSHSSGLFDYLAIDGAHDDAGLATFLEGSAFRTHDYFMDPPGTFWNYSNPNFYLAGLVAEDVGGVPYRQAVHDRVLAPLGMNRTFFLGSDVIADGDYSNGASTDTSGKPWDVAPDTYENTWARPAGYAFSNVLDYAKFVHFLYAGNPSVLSDAQRTAMQTAQTSTREFGDHEGYGYALFTDDGFHINDAWYPTKLVHHGGDIPGFAGDFYLLPETGFGLVAFTNADGAHFSSALVTALKGFGGLPASTTIPADSNVDTTRFPKYAGDYSDPHNVGPITVTATASTLTISMPDLDAAKVPYGTTLTPATADNFVLSVQGTQVLVTFIADGTGTYRWLRTRPFVGERPATPGVHRPHVTIDPVAFRERLRATL